MIGAIQQAWCRETSSTPDEWTKRNPSRGQCAVTALLIQELMGGEMLRTKVRGESHYYNMTPEGSLDLTGSQFGPFNYEEVPEPRTRAYVLSFPDTLRRYELLRKRFLQVLGDS